ncbi:hypothetical protein [Actinophytocola gossypii]|uniref:Uncharacterized protein n=1 Tax=Actinophytocola gossypii TaxID=2812003 RepID=A0ABT2J8U4_9PSEU|nr:hypothetical protein [Actinophytocola gossypii]MCT2584126.1 hypothetical protein [Actinophytocola gossypii]
MVARRVDFLAAGVVSTFGAGLFTGLAPAASLAGPWLLVALVVAGGLGYLTVLSSWERPLATAPTPVRRVLFGVGVLGRLAAAVAIAGTFGQYLTPARERLGAVVLAVLVTVVTVAVPRVPALVVRAGAAVVLGSLALVVLACFAIEPVSPAVALEQGGSALGLVASAGLLTVCFLGVGPPARPGEPGMSPFGTRLSARGVVDVHLPDSPRGVATRRTGEDGDGGSDAGSVGASSGGDEDGVSGPRAGSVGASSGGDEDGVSGPRAGSVGASSGGDEDGVSGPRAGSVGMSAGGDEGGVIDSRGSGRVRRLGVLAVLAVVLVMCLAVGAAVLRQLGAPRLGLSPVPVLDALAAADAGALRPLVLVGVAVATGFALWGIVRGLVASVGGVPSLRVAIAVGGVVAVGAAVVEPRVALTVAAVLLLGDAALRLVAVRHRRVR